LLSTLQRPADGASFTTNQWLQLESRYILNFVERNDEQIAIARSFEDRPQRRLGGDTDSKTDEDDLWMEMEEEDIEDEDDDDICYDTPSSERPKDCRPRSELKCRGRVFKKSDFNDDPRIFQRAIRQELKSEVGGGNVLNQVMVTDGDRVTVYEPESRVSPLAMEHCLTPFFLMNSVYSQLNRPRSLNFVYLSRPFNSAYSGDYGQRDVMPFIYLTYSDGSRYGMPFEAADLLDELPPLFHDESVHHQIRGRAESVLPMMAYNMVLGSFWKKYKLSQIAGRGPVSSLNDRIEYEEELRMMADLKKRNKGKGQRESFCFDGDGDGDAEDDDDDQKEDELDLDGFECDELELDDLSSDLLCGGDEYEEQQKCMLREQCDEGAFNDSKLKRMIDHEAPKKLKRQ